ncbi:hypothetical protein CU102_19555 [Phyllobacterium brassicacearum]|uniref:Uncharacterized protein n=1 Tax=Phyllobacterium brassicacearum TaxID=314235 RepID=A0A2P7BGU9_9HYPH|nr:hypothetical protein CU102_19555 [Phyllobacterium brassicacearum]
MPDHTRENDRLAREYDALRSASWRTVREKNQDQLDLQACHREVPLEPLCRLFSTQKWRRLMGIDVNADMRIRIEPEVYNSSVIAP